MFSSTYSKQSIWRVIILALVVFGIGIGLGWNLHRLPSPDTSLVGSCSVQRAAQASYTNPILDCELAEGVINRELVPFKPKVVALLENYFSLGAMKHASVYFRDLNNGAWFGINERESYSPASLLKVPIMISYYKWAEEEPGVLQRSLSFDEQNVGAGGFQQFVKPEKEIVLGQTYSLGELVERMITYSDNQANSLLLGGIAGDRISDVYKLLGLTADFYRDPAANLTVKQYAGFFRILYNASYLDREHSEAALELLSRASFRGGLVAGVPQGTKVAHKFGERGVGEDRQFHDCGIVYYPNRPYLLCVMTRGSDYWHQISVISEVSKLVYNEVNRQFIGD